MVESPPSLLPGGWIIVHFHEVTLGVIFPPVNDINQFFAHFAAGGAAGEEVFRPIDFRGFGEDGRAPLGGREDQLLRPRPDWR